MTLPYRLPLQPRTRGPGSEVPLQRSSYPDMAKIPEQPEESALGQSEWPIESATGGCRPSVLRLLTASLIQPMSAELTLQPDES